MKTIKVNRNRRTRESGKMKNNTIEILSQVEYRIQKIKWQERGNAFNSTQNILEPGTQKKDQREQFIVIKEDRNRNVL